MWRRVTWAAEREARWNLFLRFAIRAAGADQAAGGLAQVLADLDPVPRFRGNR